jgi:hypothetical protein
MPVNTNIRLAKIGFYFFIGYFLILIAEVTLSILNVVCYLNNGNFDVVFPLVFWGKLVFAFIGVILLLISFITTKRNLPESQQNKNITLLRNFFTAVLILIPITAFYFIGTALAAWGETIDGIMMWTGGNLVFQAVLFTPFFILFYRSQKSEANIRTEQRRFFSTLPNLIVLIISILTYFIVLFLYYKVISSYGILFTCIILGVQAILCIFSIVLYFEYAKELPTLLINSKK